MFFIKKSSEPKPLRAIYRCENCGLEIDRDLNAAIMLSRLAKA
ncbi:zinc ribbon domain-containing protein [Sphaerospermopsis torques-reginae]